MVKSERSYSFRRGRHLDESKHGVLDIFIYNGFEVELVKHVRLYIYINRHGQANVARIALPMNMVGHDLSK